ncbi:DUF397 domain-containing protein [Nocardia sp. NPDC046473]|uniref:DUF397 domain-containing protein n=1 Tax=Nocardia sp. NPDC046473 TaxID=3155733 RepID=UPI0033CCE2C4
MSTVDSAADGWFKSSYSSANQSCVEVRFDGARVLVRDSKYQGTPAIRPILAFSNSDWSAFLSTL